MDELAGRDPRALGRARRRAVRTANRSAAARQRRRALSDPRLETVTGIREAQRTPDLAAAVSEPHRQAAPHWLADRHEGLPGPECGRRPQRSWPDLGGAGEGQRWGQRATAPEGPAVATQHHAAHAAAHLHLDRDAREQLRREVPGHHMFTGVSNRWRGNEKLLGPEKSGSFGSIFSSSRVTQNPH